jgi:hypothetical protein
MPRRNIDIDEFRHKIDALTPDVPDGMTRSQIATLTIAMQMQGAAVAMYMLTPELLNDSDARSQLAIAFQKLANELIKSCAN